MEKRALNLFIIILILTLMISLATADISISEVNEVYNLGDKLYVTVTTTPSAIYGNFEINLNCVNNSVNLYKVPAEPSFLPEEKQIISTYVSLKKDVIGNLSGNCNVVASLGDEQISTESFLITNKINIISSLDKINYDPGEAIKLTIEATKANGHPLNGFLEVSEAVEIVKLIEEGIATEIFAMPETTEAGNYKLNIFVYDKIGAEVLNQANSSISFTINQIPDFIQTSLSKVEIIPGEEFSYGLDIYDQSGKRMDGAISVLIISPDKSEIERSLDSGEIDYISLPTNATPGTWKIRSSFTDIVDEKEFNVASVQKVEFDFLESILIIKNVGNDVYNKTIEVHIGEEIKKLDLNLELGEERRFSLKAPKGDYDVVVTDGISSTEKTLLLTGGAISVNDLSGFGWFTKYPLIWIFLIIVLALVVIVLFFKYRKKTIKFKDKLRGVKSKMGSGISSSIAFTNKSPDSQSLDLENIKGSDKDMVDLSDSKVNGAEASLVLKGRKNKSSVVAVKIKNHGELGANAKQELVKILDIARIKKGVIEIKGNYVMLVFTPLVTRTFNNEALASKVGFDISEELKKYNKKFKDKINFSIGINSGDLICSVEGRKLRYTSIGGVILLAKKMADLGENEVLVSDDVRKKLMRGLKVEKVEKIGNTQIYSVLNVLDQADNKEKLAEILHRMEREK